MYMFLGKRVTSHHCLKLAGDTKHRMVKHTHSQT